MIQFFLTLVVLCRHTVFGPMIVFRVFRIHLVVLNNPLNVVLCVPSMLFFPRLPSVISNMVICVSNAWFSVA